MLANSDWSQNRVPTIIQSSQYSALKEDHINVLKKLNVILVKHGYTECESMEANFYSPITLSSEEVFG
jgi:hypothetical protein